VTDVTAQPAALEPLRAALIARATADADQVRAASEEEGMHAVTAAREQASALLAQARAQGEADAAALLGAERARVRRAARAVVLQAQHAVYRELLRQASAAVRELLGDPARRDRLEAAVRGELGEPAVIRQLPGGGVAGETPGGNVIDASVEALVEMVIAGLDLEQLWAAS
jgi:hypothetical protein